MFQEWFSQTAATVANVVVALSAAVVAIVGLAGLQQWKRELKGKSKFDLARRLAILALEFKDQFHATRNVFTFAGESADRKRGENESDAEALIVDEWHARGKRMEVLRRVGKKLHEASWEASILLDQEVPQFVQPLEELFRDLSVSFQTYFQSQLQAAKRPAFAAVDANWLPEHYFRVYGSADDDMGKRADDRVEALLEKLKAYVK